MDQSPIHEQSKVSGIPMCDQFQTGLKRSVFDQTISTCIVYTNGLNSVARSVAMTGHHITLYHW